MFGISTKMLRAVSQNGKRVEFVNGAAGFVGTLYKYECETTAKAKTFAEYCDRRDPENEDMPIAVGPEVAASFGAVETS